MVFPIGQRFSIEQKNPKSPLVLARLRKWRTDFCLRRKSLLERAEETESKRIVWLPRVTVKPAVGLATGVSVWGGWGQLAGQPKGVGDLSDVSPWK